MYLVFFCFKKPVKSENKIEIVLPLVHWCESIHYKLQSLTTSSSDVGVNILTPSKLKVIVSIFHNLEKVPVSRTGAYRHKKALPTIIIMKKAAHRNPILTV